MAKIITCPYFINDGFSNFCMNGKFPVDCYNCNCKDLQIVEQTDTNNIKD